eukprot:GHVN01106762.1.p1 GENE.GHVN01106762.1~~GHVN01106762.1.p1  ORF type:complete len:444 (-),score=65.80 GHVN01106762.1:1647-2978(-)
MKFGEKLRTYAVPEWSEHYLKYKTLKKFLEKANGDVERTLTGRGGFGLRWVTRKRPGIAVSSTGGVSVETEVKPGELEHPLSDGGSVEDMRKRDRRTEADALLQKRLDEFWALVEVEVRRIEAFHKFETHMLNELMDSVEFELNDLLDVRHSPIRRQTSSSFSKRGLSRTRLSLCDVSGQHDASPPASPRQTLVRWDGGTRAGDDASGARWDVSRRSDGSQEENDGNIASASHGSTASHGADNVEEHQRPPAEEPKLNRALSLTCGVAAGQVEVPPTIAARLPHIPKDSKDERLQHAKSRDAHLKRLQRSLISIWDTFDRLDSYVNLNSLAMYKILKKRDKVMGVKLIAFQLEPIKARLNDLLMKDATKHLPSLRLLSPNRSACWIFTASHRGGRREAHLRWKNFKQLCRRTFLSDQLTAICGLHFFWAAVQLCLSTFLYCAH